MTALSEAERVVNSLTEAQRRMILTIGDGQPRGFALGVTGFALLRMKLAFVNELGARHLTDEGHAVRKLLEAKS